MRGLRRSFDADRTLARISPPRFATDQTIQSGFQKPTKLGRRFGHMIYAARIGAAVR